MTRNVNQKRNIKFQIINFEMLSGYQKSILHLVVILKIKIRPVIPVNFQKKYFFRLQLLVTFGRSAAKSLFKMCEGINKMSVSYIKNGQLRLNIWGKKLARRSFIHLSGEDERNQQINHLPFSKNMNFLKN